MPKTLAEESSPYTLNPALLALKPRQVLISSISRADMGKESSKALTLESEQKALLLRSVAQYLERCGFSKCFKKLLSEAEIEKKELNSNTLPDLEEMYSEFLKKSHLEAVEVKDESGNVDEKEKEEEKKEVVVNGITEASAMEGVEKVKKQRKKKKKETKSEVTEEEEKVVKETDAEMEEGKKEKKKKKKNKSKSTEAESLGDDDKEKVSKKRKRSEPEEAKAQAEEDDEESKRRKKEEKNVVEEEEAVQETPVKQSDVQENGNAVEKSETKSTNQKSGKGLSNSKEPKKPFQRVNVEEVVFADDRLKDNSYWAKDGADIGYGAKAQEVLGQVRGRGFRHEKTKKKRGSYRGGEIDLESHSVKFDYSDEE